MKAVLTVIGGILETVVTAWVLVNLIGSISLLVLLLTASISTLTLILAQARPMNRALTGVHARAQLTYWLLTGGVSALVSAAVVRGLLQAR